MAELISYLPPYLQEYKEIKSALNAEDPEFVLLWDASEKVLKNQFIETADEYGISRFEKLLGVFPSDTEDLESRRSRVKSRWFDYMPYTLKSLILRLTVLCGENNFKITRNYDSYEIKIETDLELFGQIDELARIILKIIPCNMNVNSRNELNCECSGNLFIGGAVSFTESFFITNDSNEFYTAKGGSFGSGSVVTEIISVWFLLRKGEYKKLWLNFLN